MIGRNVVQINLTNAEFWQTLFLTLTFLLSLAPRLSHADALQSVYTVEEKQRIADIENYLHQKAHYGFSLLPGGARSTMGWFSGNWHSMSLSNEGSTDDTSSNDTMSTSQPSDSSVPVNVSSNYHHKGFLPTHDAMMMGVGAGQNILDNKLQFTARPYIGQSWDSLRHYWGTEVAMTVAQHSDGLPWGKIAVGYVGGDEALTDHGRGMDLHGDVDLTHGFTFTSGMRQNSISGDANYVLVKWKLTFGGNP